MSDLKVRPPRENSRFLAALGMTFVIWEMSQQFGCMDRLSLRGQAEGGPFKNKPTQAEAWATARAGTKDQRHIEEKKQRAHTHRRRVGHPAVPTQINCGRLRMAE
jgi:hypothetical protein